MQELTNQIPQVTFQVDCYSADRNAIKQNFKSQTVDKHNFLEHGNVGLMPYVNNWPLVIFSPQPVDGGDKLVVLNLPPRVCYRIGNAKSNVHVNVNLEIDTLEYVLHVIPDDEPEWIHHEPATREYTTFGDYGVRDNETGELIIDISNEVKDELHDTATND